jgi:hypothetical protein
MLFFFISSKEEIRYKDYTRTVRFKPRRANAFASFLEKKKYFTPIIAGLLDLSLAERMLLLLFLKRRNTLHRL